MPTISPLPPLPLTTQTVRSTIPHVVDQIADWDEIVVFQKSQTLPRFWIELAPDSPRTLPTASSFEQAYAICLAEIDIQIWIEEDPSRLKETNAHGFTLMHMAAAAGQTEVVRWLHAQDPHLIKQANHEKWTPLHLAAFHEQLDVLSLFIEEAKELIFLIAEKPCPRTLDFLLSKASLLVQLTAFNKLSSISQHKRDKSKMSPVSSSMVPIPMTKTTPNGPPFFWLSYKTTAPSVQLLLPQTDVTLTSIEQETLLHAAAFYGYTPLLQDLLDYSLLQRTY